MVKPKRALETIGVIFVLLLLGLVWEEFDWGKLHIPAAGWPVIATVSGAAISWMVTSWVSLHNSIKQHTINTLLQSRLSATYQEKVGVLDKVYPTTNEGRTAVAEGDWLKEDDDTKKSLAALRYFLNYYEFLAVGIRTGDLHVGVLRQSMRGIITINVRASRKYISHLREPESRIYSNLLRLYSSWIRPTAWEQFCHWWALFSATEDEKAILAESAARVADDIAAEEAALAAEKRARADAARLATFARKQRHMQSQTVSLPLSSPLTDSAATDSSKSPSSTPPP